MRIPCLNSQVTLSHRHVGPTLCVSGPKLSRGSWFQLLHITEPPGTGQIADLMARHKWIQTILCSSSHLTRFRQMDSENIPNYYA
jgi:hypothetical protein